MLGFPDLVVRKVGKLVEVYSSTRWLLEWDPKEIRLLHHPKLILDFVG